MAGDDVKRSTDTTSYTALLADAQRIRGVSLWKGGWRRLRRNKAAMAALAFLVMMSTSALLTPLLPLQSPIDQDLQNRTFLSPSFQPVRLGAREGLGFKDGSLRAELAEFDAEIRELRRGYREASAPEEAQRLRRQLVEMRQAEHPFQQLWYRPGPISRALIRARLRLFGDWALPSLAGTDAMGRDLMARLFWGGRVSLIVGVVATLVSVVVGVSYGAVAGYVGGAVDAGMMRLVDVLYSIPFIFVVIVLTTILTEDSVKRRFLDPYHLDQIMVFYVVIGMIYWLTMARVVRGQIISLKNEQFVEAARIIGASRLRIIFRHLVPNVTGVVIVYLTLTIPQVMLFEAFLSFLGMGVQPPDVSWGLLSDEGLRVITPIQIKWWLVLFPGLALSSTLLALNLLGDGLRDALDPRLKTS